MGIKHSRSVPSRGLIGLYDFDRQGSTAPEYGLAACYEGPPLTNLIGSVSTIDYAATGISLTGGYNWCSVPGINTTATSYVFSSTGYNNYPATSATCCPNIFRLQDDVGGAYITVSPSTLYTYSIVYKTSSGYTHPNFMYRYEYTSGNALVTQSGTHSDNNRKYLGNGWWWAWSTFTTAATTAKMRCYFFQYEQGTTTKTYWLASAMIVAGNYTTLPPNLWSLDTGQWYWTNTPITTTSVFNNCINVSSLYGYTDNGTVSSLTYTDPVNPTFNGSSNSVRVGLEAAVKTVVQWVKPAAIGSQVVTFGVVANAHDNWLGLNADGTAQLYATQFSDVNNTSVNSTTVLTAGQWYQLAATISGNQMKLYVNGVLEASYTATFNFGSWLDSTQTYPYVIGCRSTLTQYFFNGSIQSTYLYEKDLTSDEIAHHYNATKGRFGR